MSAAMQGDFALAHGDLRSAAHAYAQAAQHGHDAELAARAFELAIALPDAALAQRSLARWRALGITPLQSASAHYALALAEADLPATRVALAQLTAFGTPGWLAALRSLANTRDRAFAARALRLTLTAATLPAAQPGLWLAAGQLARQLGEPAYALQLAQALHARSNAAVAALWLAQQQQAAGDTAQADATLDAGLRRHPHDIGLRLARASQLAAVQPARALALLAREPQNDETYALRAAIGVRSRDTGAVRTLYTQLTALPRAQRSSHAWLLGQLAEWLHRPHAALDWYAEVPAAGRHGFEADLRRAALLDQTGQPVQARALAAQLAEQSSDDPDDYRRATLLQAELSYRAGDYAASVAAYNRILLFQPQDADALYGRGVAQAEAGQTDAAIADFRAVLHLQPDNVEAQNALGFTLADARRDLPEARALIAAALQAQPHNAAIVDSWGWVNYRQGDYATAVQALRRAWRLDRSAEIGAHLARALWAAGQHAQARTVLAQAARLDPRARGVLAASAELKP